MWGQMQTRLDQRMIKHPVVFASGHEREPSQISEDGPGPVLPIESQERAGLWKLIGSEIPSKGCQALAQLLSVAPVATITKTAEPLETVGLADHGARPHDLPSLTPGVAGGTDLIQPAKGRGKVFTLG